MNRPDLAGLLPAVVDIAREAGERILAIYGSEFNVDIKQDNSPLTDADLAAHKHIVAGLSALTPQIPVLSEESAAIPYSERKQWQCYWLVDPLDGTKEFLKRNGEFTVNIALIDGSQSVLGVVYVPVTGKTYYAAEGVGAFRKTSAGTTESISVRAKAACPLVVVGSRSHQSDELRTYLDQLEEHELVSMGSSLKLCLVAEGAADLYPRIGLTSEWDTAAAQCVVEQAGGRVTAVSGETLAYNQKESVLNPYFLVFGDTSRDWAGLYQEQ